MLSVNKLCSEFKFKYQISLIFSDSCVIMRLYTPFNSYVNLCSFKMHLYIKNVITNNSSLSLFVKIKQKKKKRFLYICSQTTPLAVKLGGVHSVLSIGKYSFKRTCLDVPSQEVQILRLPFHLPLWLWKDKLFSIYRSG